MSAVYAVVFLFGVSGVPVLAAEVCPPHLLNGFLSSHERNLWRLIDTDQALRRDLRSELEQIEQVLKERPDGPESEALQYRASVILADLSVIEKRLPEATETRRRELLERGEELGRLMWEYLREDVPHSSYDIVQLARKILDLRGVEYRTLTHEEGHLGLEILQNREQTPVWMTRMVKRVGRTDSGTKIYFVPSKLRKKTAIAMMNGDRSALYIDVETLIAGRMSPTALHELDHFFARKASRGILAASLEDVGGRFAHDEPRAYTVEAVARYLDFRNRIRKYEKTPPHSAEVAVQELKPLWQEYLSRFRYGAQHARRSREVLRALSKQDAARWTVNLLPDPAAKGTAFRLSIRDAKGWTHSFPTRQSDLQAALQDVRAQWDGEIRWNDTMIRLFDEILNEQSQKLPATLEDYAQILGQSESQINALWVNSRLRK